MGDEKLPPELSKLIDDVTSIDWGWQDAMTARMKLDMISAIHRYAREREAAALERAAQVCERERQRILADPNDPSWTEHLASASRDIRELKPTEPAK